MTNLGVDGKMLPGDDAAAPRFAKGFDVHGLEDILSDYVSEGPR